MKRVYITLILMLFFGTVCAKDATFVWTANPETDNIVEYHLHYNVGENSTPPYNGSGLNEGDSPITVGNVVEYTVTGLLEDDTYYFALTAHSIDNFSGYSVIASVYPDPTLTVSHIKLNGGSDEN